MKFSSRVPSFDAVTLSTNINFQKACESAGVDAFQEMKKTVRKLLDAFYRLCQKLQIVYWFRLWFVVQDGHPHIHGVLFSDCKRAGRELSRLWSKYKLGYQQFKERRKRGNCLFTPIYDLDGWLSYVYGRRNKYRSMYSQFCSYHGNKVLRKLSPFDVDQIFHSADLSNFLNKVRLAR